MIKVKFHASWRPDDYVKNWISKYTKDGNTWNDLLLTQDDDYDFIVIFNHPAENYSFKKDRAIIFQGEPDSIRRSWGTYYKPNHNEFFCVFDTENNFNSVGWSFVASYQELLDMKYDKTKLISGVISSKNSMICQKRRTDFVQYYLKSFTGYDHYGRGTGIPTVDKSDAIFPYKYTFNAENSYEMNYYTEKVTDAIVGESLCFYDGCPNIHEHFDSRAYIKIDLGNQKEAFDIITDAINNNEYEKRLPFIKQERLRILNELQPMPLVEKILKDKGIV
jgi:hypothetical protein